MRKLNYFNPKRAEQELLTAARQGQADAYSALWKKHNRAVTAAMRTLAYDNAEDVTAEAFAQVWERLQKDAEPIKNFRAYLMTVARNIAATWYRDATRERARLLHEIALDAADVSVEERENRRDIALAFKQIPPHWQELLWLLDVEKLPRTLVANRLGLSPNTVTVNARRARERLREEWLSVQLPVQLIGSHSDTLKNLPRYVRGSLSAKMRQPLDEHLEHCESCGRIYAALSDSDNRLGRAAVFALWTGGVGVAVAAAQGTAATTPAAAAVLHIKNFVPQQLLSSTAVAAGVALVTVAGAAAAVTLPTSPATQEATSSDTSNSAARDSSSDTRASGEEGTPLADFDDVELAVGDLDGDGVENTPADHAIAHAPDNSETPLQQSGAVAGPFSFTQTGAANPRNERAAEAPTSVPVDVSQLMPVGGPDPKPITQVIVPETAEEPADEDPITDDSSAVLTEPEQTEAEPPTLDVNEPDYSETSDGSSSRDRSAILECGDREFLGELSCIFSFR
ncbi:sigma-70 family RNA polymerase sigma factor [Canibacter zhoujuaniae]|uniref:sigma-70 family RNA polymerase sigma factor n=1 Tax=Canibacter zhoujuaniae TaxID=2708343 RepID=UPI00141EBF94|nr:sigma-70 family RNA polymerase sigma factor [Canibacter zhoujuaniae]